LRSRKTKTQKNRGGEEKERTGGKNQGKKKTTREGT
jgi:hypothetical protein